MPTAQWEEKSLAELAPQTLAVLANGVAALQTGVSTLNAIQAAAVALIPPTTIAPSAATAVAAAAGALASATADLIEDVRNAGIHLLVVPPSSGGSTHFANHLELCLRDEGHAERPQFSQSSYLVVYGLLMESEDAGTLLTNFNSLMTIFVQTQAAADLLLPFVPGINPNAFQKTRALVDETNPKEVLSFVEHFFKQQLNNTARPLDRCLWRSQTVNDLLPRSAQDILKRSQRTLEGIAVWAASDPFSAYLAFLERILTELTAQVTAITDSLAAMTSLFVDVEARSFEVSPFRGGTAALADGVSDIFGSASEFVHSTNSTITGGLVWVGGSATQEGAQAILDTFNTLFHSDI